MTNRRWRIYCTQNDTNFVCGFGVEYETLATTVVEDTSCPQEFWFWFWFCFYWPLSQRRILYFISNHGCIFHRANKKNYLARRRSHCHWKKRQQMNRRDLNVWGNDDVSMIAGPTAKIGSSVIRRRWQRDNPMAVEMDGLQIKRWEQRTFPEPSCSHPLTSFLVVIRSSEIINIQLTRRVNLLLCWPITYVQALDASFFVCHESPTLFRVEGWMKSAVGKSFCEISLIRFYEFAPKRLSLQQSIMMME